MYLGYREQGHVSIWTAFYAQLRTYLQRNPDMTHVRIRLNQAAHRPNGEDCNPSQLLQSLSRLIVEHHTQQLLQTQFIVTQGTTSKNKRSSCASEQYSTQSTHHMLLLCAGNQHLRLE